MAEQAVHSTLLRKHRSQTAVNLSMKERIVEVIYHSLPRTSLRTLNSTCIEIFSLKVSNVGRHKNAIRSVS